MSDDISWDGERREKKNKETGWIVKLRECMQENRRKEGRGEETVENSRVGGAE